MEGAAYPAGARLATQCAVNQRDGRVTAQTIAAQTGAPGQIEGPVGPGASAVEPALSSLRANAAAWVATGTAERIRLLEHVLQDVAAVADRWATACISAEGLDPNEPSSGEEALVGPYFFLRNVRLLRDALRDIERHGVPRIPGPVRTRPDGQVTARVFPTSVYDRLFYPGITGEVWMEPGVTAEGLSGTQALAYHGSAGTTGRVCLVLGAGNVSSIGPMDIICKLFVDNSVVMFKPHPVTAYLGPILELGLRALVERGVLRFVAGGADVGAVLCRHPEMDEVHITGSNRTYDAIVFGPGSDGQDRKSRDERLIDKPVSAELGNVSPVIVVPGRWSAAEIAGQAENIATMLTNNGGFNCNAARVIVTHAGWSQREQLLAAVRDRLSRTAPRVAYYPGAGTRFDAFVAAHPEARQLGRRTDNRLPWAIVEGVDPEQRDDICFTTEAFCSVFAETALPADSTAEFVDRAVAFANDTLWGTLNATVIVHPRTQREPVAAAAVERALADLRYGTVSLNAWAAVGFAVGVMPWGAYPGNSPTAIGSGVGMVHNTMMFARAQKSVIRAPFRPLLKPVWYVSHRTAHRLTPRLSRFEASPSLAALPAIVALALRG
jgi:acyl-CoA reductase-like NAD-dependent aldehyde dehydrogenase